MKEKNQDTLKDALKRLPNYQAKEGLWDALEQNLDADTKVDELHKEELDAAVHRLPRYRAPHGIWSKIEKRLNRRSIFSQRKWAVAAAISALLTIGIGTWLMLRSPSSVIPGPTVSEKKAEAPIKLKDAERATYSEELEEIYLSIESCLESSSKSEQDSFSESKNQLKQIKSDSLHLIKIKALRKKICDL